jgi:HPt (histidine-containing phosphotransfer) domain-containing protein
MLSQADKKYFQPTPYTNSAVLLEIKEFIGEEGDDAVQELVETYLAKTPVMITKIADDLRNCDLQNLKSDVHSLKGSSASVGAISIFNMCKKIEEALRAEDKLKVDSLFEELVATFKFVKEELQAWI